MTDLVYDSIKYYINGVDKTDIVLTSSLNIQDNLTSKINTAAFKIYDISGAYKPSTSDTVTIYDAYANKIFVGVIANFEEKRIGFDPNTQSEMMEYNISCQDWTKMLTKRLVVETYKNMTCKEIIQAIIDKYYPTEGFTLNNVEEGPEITQISFNYKAGDKCVDDLAKAVAYDWYVDYDKDIHFFSAETPSSSMTITDATENWTNLVIKPDASQLRNRVYIRGGIYYSDPYTQDIKADGTQKEFLLAYTPNDEDFAITISSVSKTVGIDNVDDKENFDFMLNRKDKAIKMGESAWALANTPLAANTVLVVAYSYEIPVLIVQEDTNSIAAMQSLEGGDGAYEHIIIDKNITSIAAARDRAAAELAEFANPITKGSFTSYDSDCAGLKSGNIITINSTRRNVNADYLIDTIKITQISSTLLKYDIQFSGRLYGFVDLLMQLFKRSSGVILGLDEVLDAFNLFRDSTNGIQDETPILTLGAKPYKWSNAEGTTPNKARWNLSEWSA